MTTLKRIKHSKGYVLVHLPEHPRAHKGYVKEHIYIAGLALGSLLPPNAVVHHVNEDKTDNRPQNLVICEDDNYHRLLHRRLRVVKAGFDPNTHQRCCQCQITQPFEAFAKWQNGPNSRSRCCKNCAHKIWASWCKRNRKRVR